MAEQLAHHPTHIQCLVPNPPSFLGAVDASGAGVGGFWLSTPYTSPIHPMVFQQKFPSAVTDNFVTASNPSGTLTNSNLELAALVLGAAVLRHYHPTQHANLSCADDNSAAVRWCNKGSTSSTNARAYLLRWLANLTRVHDFALSAHFAAGTTNTLADFCSRSFHLSDQDFTIALQHHFPINGGWTVVHPPNDLALHMTSALSSKLLPMESPPLGKTPLTIPGNYGPTTATAYTWTQPPTPFLTPYLFSKFLHTATAPATFLPPHLRCAVERWVTPFAPLARRWPTWDSTTPDYYHPANSSFV
jgi:hypothetical protein